MFSQGENVHEITALRLCVEVVLMPRVTWGWETAVRQAAGHRGPATTAPDGWLTAVTAAFSVNHPIPTGDCGQLTGYRGKIRLDRLKVRRPQRENKLDILGSTYE